MALTEAAAVLTERHRQAQAALMAVTVGQVAAAWRAFSLDDIDRTWPAVEELLLAIITVRGRDSAGLAAGYFQGYRLLEGAGGAADTKLAAIPTLDDAAGSLRFVGPFGAKKLIAARQPDVMAKTFVKVAGDATRLVLNQGRDTLIESVTADRQAVGWVRVTSGKACAFCAMLASRGPVYKAAGAAFPAHNSCGCSAEPVYHADQWPPSARKWQAEWHDATAGLSGDDARLAFRRHIEGR